MWKHRYNYLPHQRQTASLSCASSPQSIPIALRSSKEAKRRECDDVNPLFESLACRASDTSKATQKSARLILGPGVVSWVGDNKGAVACTPGSCGAAGIQVRTGFNMARRGWNMSGGKFILITGWDGVRGRLRAAAAFAFVCSSSCRQWTDRIDGRPSNSVGIMLKWAWFRGISIVAYSAPLS